MPPHIVNLHYTLRYAAPLVLVLEAAPDRWQMIYNLATALMERLPGRCQKLYFLGNRNPYPVALARDLREQAPAWYSANCGRVSCVGPLIETLEQEGYAGQILIIANQCPVDLEDVRQTPVTPHRDAQVPWAHDAQERPPQLLLANVSVMPFTTAPFTTAIEQVDGQHGIERVLSALEDPPRALQITAPGFVPLGYDLREGGRAQVHETNGEFRLDIIPSGERLDLHLRAIAEISPVLTVRRDKGGVTQVSGAAEAPWWRALLWQPLPEQLRPIVEAGIAGRAFCCPQCGESHPYDCLVCPRGDVILQGLPLNTCLLLSREGWRSLADGYAHPLGGERLLIRTGRIYTQHDGRWLPMHVLQPYEQVDDDLWALFHTL